MSAALPDAGGSRDPSVSDRGSLPRLSQREFGEFAALIYNRCGIHLAPIKLIMLSSRLSKRLRALSFESFAQYLEYVRSPKGMDAELVHLIDVVTTNKTEFFREPKHYDILTQKVLPDLARRGHVRRLRLWSAGCSTGEEPYTLAMVLDRWCSTNGGSYSITASDISTRVLETAGRGVYQSRHIESIPENYRREYLMRGKDRMSGLFRIVPELRNRVDFMRINLVDDAGFGIQQKFDIIFCRNVVIYFDRETQTALFDRFWRQLAPGGYLFIGLSETLHRINDKFVSLTGSVYHKPESEQQEEG